MFDTSLFGTANVERKLAEISFKYLETVDNLLSFNTLMKELEIRHGMTKKGRESQLAKLDSLNTVFADLVPKYAHFASIAGKETGTETVKAVTDDGTEIEVNLSILDRQMLENKIDNLRKVLVECEGFAFSYPTIVSHNGDKDSANLVELAKENEANEATGKNVEDKIRLFTKWLDEINGKAERAARA